MFADFLKIIFYDPDRGWVEDTLEEKEFDPEDEALRKSLEEALE